MVSAHLIADFWRWFQSVAGEFGEQLDNQWLIDELDARIAKIGKLSWEIGPGFENQRNNSLVLTPSGDRALLAVTREVIKAAPVCPGWEFYPAKPPKRWQRRFVLQSGQGDEIEVDASGARYVLLKYPDGVFDLLVADRNLATLPADLQETAVDVLVDGELGEELRMIWIHSVEVVAEFDDEMQKKSSTVDCLARHLQSLAR